MTISGVQLLGSTNNTTAAEVEVATRALRGTLRPEDVLGHYCIGGKTSGTLVNGTANSTSANNVFAFRNASSTIVAVKKVMVSHVFITTVGNTQEAMCMYKCTNWTVSDSGGTQMLPSTGCKMRSTMPDSVMNNGDIRIAAAVNLTNGTRSVESNPMGGIGFVLQNFNGYHCIPPMTPIFDSTRINGAPLFLRSNEGFFLNFNTSFSGSQKIIAVSVHWMELAVSSL